MPEVAISTGIDSGCTSPTFIMSIDKTNKL